MILTYIFLKNKPIKTFRDGSIIVLGSFLYWLIGALAFAPMLGNLGIIIRERNMFLPAFIIFAVTGLAKTPKFKKFEWYYYHKKQEWSKRNKALQQNTIVENSPTL